MTTQAHTSRPRRLSVSTAGFTKLAWTALVALILIVPSGALVRLTDSGLGCPDWPKCNGEIVPKFDGHTAIEYSNRVFSAVVVLLCVLTWLAARRLPDASRQLRRWAAIPALTSLAQGPLGALTVLSDLHPVMVSSHFLVSLVALGGGVVVLLLAYEHRDRRQRVTNVPRRRAMSAALFALAGVIVTGVLVTASGPHSGDPEVVRRWWNVADAAAVHVRFVIAFVVIGVAVAIWMWLHRPHDALVRRLGVAFVPLLGLQIALGEYQYRNGLPWTVIVVHVTTAAVLWAVACALWWRASRPARS